VARGRCRLTASTTLWLPFRTRGNGEKCRGSQRASPGEESTAREREKKGGTAVMGQRPFTRGGAAERKLGGSGREWRHAVGGREGGPGGAWSEGRGGGVQWPGDTAA
jgi:hypothetical protein